MTPDERTALDRRRRHRNWAMLGALGALVALFYFITIAKFVHH
jgi:hypothetical protein